MARLVRHQWKIGLDFPDYFDLINRTPEKYKTSSEFKSFVNPIGIEVEVENYSDNNTPRVYLWQPREDGSLKNKGMELVSGILSGVLIDYAINELIAILEKQKNLDWSHRTSIHVHSNLSDLPVHKIKWLIAYYALTEPLWYDFCDSKRIGNSFCFPLCSANPRGVSPGKMWPKYCGLNLGTALCQFNTVEFRQMHGHQDMDLLKRWIRRISHFVNYIQHTTSIKLKRDIENYLVVGDLSFRNAFPDPLPTNVEDKIYDNAKWVSDFLNYQG